MAQLVSAARVSVGCCLGLLAAAGAAAQVGTISVVAVSDRAYGAFPAQTTLAPPLSAAPSVGLGGRVAFTADLDTPGGFQWVVVLGDGAAPVADPVLIMRQGQPAPGTPGGTLQSFEQAPVVMSDGRVAVLATVEVPGLSSWPYMLYFADANGITPAHVFQQPLPGLVGAGAHAGPQSFAAFPGHTVFLANIALYPQGGSALQGIWAGSAGSLALLARMGLPVPLHPTLTWGSFYGPVSITPDGFAGFPALIWPTVAEPSVIPRFFAGTAGDLRAVNWAGQAAPGIPGATFTMQPSFHALNADGDIICFGTIITEESEHLRALVIDRSGDREIVGMDGDPAPGTGAQFRWFAGLAAPPFVGADNEWIAVRGVLEGPGVIAGQNDRGLWAGRAGDFRLIARMGGASPGFPGLWHQVEPLEYAINGRGQAVFRGQLAGPGVTSGNTGVLYYADPWGRVGPIVRASQVVQVAPGVQRTLRRFDILLESAGSSGRAACLSDDGYFAFHAECAESTMQYAVLAAKLPEPCYGDCNLDGGLSAADFACFQAYFAQGHPSADCNEDAAFTVSDFACFQTRFTGGCS